MKIYLFPLKQTRDFCENLSLELKRRSHKCIIFDSSSEFYNQILDKEDLPDIYLMDFFIYNHYVFNIFSFMKENDVAVPVIFFNDPQPHPESTGYYWKHMLDLLFASTPYKSSSYMHIINYVSDFIDDYKKSSAQSENIKKEKNNEEVTQKDAKNRYLNEIKEIKKCLSSGELLLFEKLYENANKSVSEGLLMESIQKTKKSVSRNTVVCNISAIRKKMKEKDFFNAQIVKSGNGYKLIIF